MTSKVFFTKVTDNKEDNLKKLVQLFDKSEFIGNLDENDKIAIKTHFGERGNNTHLNPAYSKVLIDKLNKSNKKVFLTDTNTLYHH